MVPAITIAVLKPEHLPFSLPSKLIKDLTKVNCALTMLKR